MARYVCTGTCGGSVNEEEYQAGKTTCGTSGCTKEGQPFTRREDAAGEDKTVDETVEKKP